MLAVSKKLCFDDTFFTTNKFSLLFLLIRPTCIKKLFSFNNYKLLSVLVPGAYCGEHEFWQVGYKVNHQDIVSTVR